MAKVLRPSLSSISSSFTSCCNLQKPCAVRDCSIKVRWRPDGERRGGYICKRHMKELINVATVVVEDWYFTQMLGEGGLGVLDGSEWW